MKLLLIDTKGNTNKFGEIIGHPLKVLNQSYNIISKVHNISFLLANSFKFTFIKDYTETKEFLPFSVTIYTNFIGRIKNHFRRILNILLCINYIYKMNPDKIWFVNQDNYLLYLLPNKIKAKSFINIYSYNFNIFRINKFKAVFTSIHNLASNSLSNTYLIPDYISKFNSNKSDKVNTEDILYIGSINQDKDTIAIIKLFEDKVDKRRLFIYGKIYDKSVLSYISKSEKNEKIIIKNEYLNDDSYQKYLENFKYVILPYKKNSYLNRGSGVYFDSIKFNCIPIFPSFMKNYYGIKYDNYDNLVSILNNLECIPKSTLSNVKNNYDEYEKLIQKLIYEK